MMEKLSPEEFDENYKRVTERFNNAVLRSGRKEGEVKLLAATKTVDADTVNYAIKSGIKYIGENKVQEFKAKYPDIIPVHHHFIGHLQTNKVKDIVGRVELIHSVDSLRLAEAVSAQSKKLGTVTDILLEVNIGGEESKSGFKPFEVIENAEKIAEKEGISVKGLMTIPPVCENDENNRKYFKKMYNLFIDISAQKIDNISMDVLSMGMSDDFETAIEEGATIVRVGTALFGKRLYI